jgi:hypothetical protein
MIVRICFQTLITPFFEHYSARNPDLAANADVGDFAGCKAPAEGSQADAQD